MKQVSLGIALAMMLVMFVVGIGLGYFMTPGYQEKMYTKETMGLGKADKNVDKRYLNQMVAHHRGAILLAEQIAQKTTRKELKDLATEIRKNEPKLIHELYSWKSDWYKDDSKVGDPEVANLGLADEKVDLRFLNALIAHHQLGIEMTKEIRAKSSRAEVLDNADDVEAFLTGSMVTLKQWRKDWYGVDY